VLQQQVAEVITATVTSAERAARDVVCPVHHKRATVTEKKTSDGYQLSISDCCCQDLADRASEARDRAVRGA
jgi:hypothetical protein